MRAVVIGGLLLAWACGGDATSDPGASGGAAGSSGAATSAGGQSPGGSAGQAGAANGGSSEGGAPGGGPGEGGTAGASTGGGAGEAGTPETGGGPATGGASGAGGSINDPTTGGTAGAAGSVNDPTTGGAGGNVNDPATGGSDPGSAGTGGAGGDGSLPNCGNGIVEGSEACDHGSKNGLFYGDGSGCTQWCRVEPRCRTNGVTGACETRCGDGNIDDAEACDDGNLDPGDGCSASCSIEAGFTCSWDHHLEGASCTSPDVPSHLSCLQMAITYRDFDGAHTTTGHPDFFYMGATRSGGGKTTCVPNASGANLLPQQPNGSCPATDATDPCVGLVEPTLDANGRPKLNVARPGGSVCKCTFTDWDATGVLTSAPGVQTCNSGPASPSYVQNVDVTMVESESSFAQWYADSSLSTRTRSSLFLSSDSLAHFPSTMTTRTVWDDLHDIWLRLRNLPVADDAPTTLSSGFFPLEDSPRPKVCNLFPYWRAPASCIANDGASISQQWDPRGWNSGGPEPQPNENRGAPVKPVVGLPRNFYFTTEGRWLFRFQGADLLEFVADDDVWVFVNGRLVLDLGGTHERMRGSVRLDSEGDSAEWTKLLLDGFTPLPGAMGSGTVTGLGLERGRVYEIAFFHADRQPRESNFSFYVPTLLSRRSLCSPSNQ